MFWVVSVKETTSKTKQGEDFVLGKIADINTKVVTGGGGGGFILYLKRK
jgi:hypothetical protein